jgi:hypothetical protein
MVDHPAWTRTTLEPLIAACHDAQERAFMDATTLSVMIECAREHHAAVMARSTASPATVLL